MNDKNCVLRISIPHKLCTNREIAYSAYHRWEHIFIRLLENHLYKDGVVLSGYTTAMLTCLFFKLSSNYSFCEDDLKNLLMHGYVSKRFFSREIAVIDNELACVGAMYNITVDKCERGKPSSPEKMIFFRKNAYAWDRFSLTLISEVIEPSIKQSAYIDSKRDDIISSIMTEMNEGFWEQKNLKWSIGDKSLNVLGYHFVLLGIKCCFDFRYLTSLVSQLDCERGFFQFTLRVKYPVCFFIMPRLEVHDGKNWLILFSFLNCRYLEYLLNTILEKINYNLGSSQSGVRSVYLEIR